MLVFRYMGEKQPSFLARIGQRAGLIRPKTPVEVIGDNYLGQMNNAATREEMQRIASEATRELTDQIVRAIQAKPRPVQEIVADRYAQEAEESRARFEKSGNENDRNSAQLKARVVARLRKDFGDQQ